MTTQRVCLTSEDAGAIKGPHIRLIQPLRFDAPDATETAYIRLGTYVDGGRYDESRILTHYKATRSTLRVVDMSAAAQAAEFAANVHGVPSSNFDPSTQFKLRVYVDETPIEPVLDGTLRYADGDLSENVTGSVLEKYGKGHVVRVCDGDSSAWIKQGKYDLAARNGIFVTAGDFGFSDATTLNATEKSKWRVQNVADINLVASGYIKQVAFGDLDEITYGNTRKFTKGNVWITIEGDQWSKTVGNKTAYFFGNSYDETHGTKTALFFGAALDMNFASVTAIAFGMKSEFNFVGKLVVTVGASLEFKMSTDLEFTALTKASIKGSDYFESICTNHIKLTGATEVKKTPVTLEDNELNALKTLIKTQMSNVDTEKSNVKTSSLDVNVRRSGTHLSNSGIHIYS